MSADRSVTVTLSLVVDGEVKTRYEPVVFKSEWHARWWYLKLFIRVFGLRVWTWPRRIA
jgi:hypothetical protein